MGSGNSGRREDERFMALLLAAEFNKVKKIETLLREDPRWAKIRARDGGASALMVAASNGYAEAVTALLPFSRVKADDTDGNTALMRSVMHEDNEEVFSLLLPESDVAAKNDRDWTALDHAVYWGRWRCAEAFIKFAAADDGIAPSELDAIFQSAIKTAEKSNEGPTIAWLIGATTAASESVALRSELPSGEAARPGPGARL